MLGSNVAKTFLDYYQLTHLLHNPLYSSSQISTHTHTPTITATASTSTDSLISSAPPSEELLTNSLSSNQELGDVMTL